MLTQQKGKQVRLYILEDDEARLDKLSEATGVNVTTAITLIVSAGLKACEGIGYRLPLPLRFQIAEGVPEAAKSSSKGRR
jgi:hypothetical protein